MVGRAIFDIQRIEHAHSVYGALIQYDAKSTSGESHKDQEIDHSALNGEHAIETEQKIAQKAKMLAASGTKTNC